MWQRTFSINKKDIYVRDNRSIGPGRFDSRSAHLSATEKKNLKLLKPKLMLLRKEIESIYKANRRAYPDEDISFGNPTLYLIKNGPSSADYSHQDNNPPTKYTEHLVSISITLVGETS